MIAEFVLGLALVACWFALGYLAAWLLDEARIRAREEYLEELDRAYREAITPSRVTDHEDSTRGPSA